MMRQQRLALLAWLPFVLTHCAQPSKLRGQIAGLDKVIAQAERNGAMRCAPRELSIARSQLEFAVIELDQGFASKAQAHLAKAEPNARAADLLSPPRYCTTRGSIGPAAPDPDSDGDGVADSLDQCKLDPEDKDGTLDADGCPEPDDSDGSGLPRPSPAPAINGPAHRSPPG